MSIGSLNELQQIKWPYGAVEQVINGQTTATTYSYPGTLSAGYYAFSAVSLDNKASNLVVSSASNDVEIRIDSGETEYFRLTTTASDVVLEAEGSVPTANVGTIAIPSISNQSSIEYANGVFLIGTETAQNTIYKLESTGKPIGNWQQINVGNNGAVIKYLNSKWFSGGNGSATTSPYAGISVSTDATTWNYISQNINGRVYNITYENSKYWAVGYKNYIASSTDAVTWDILSSGIPDTTTAWTITAGPSIMLVGTNASEIYSTPDGQDYKTVDASSGVVYDINYINSVFVATKASGTLLTSTDGATWTSRSSGFGTSLINGSTYGNGLYVIGGGGGKLATSTDLVTWTLRTSNFGTSIIYGLGYGAGVYVAVGAGGRLTNSTDGITWTAQTSGFGTSSINKVRYLNNLFVAVGNAGKLTTSTDGTTWTLQTSNFGTSIIYDVAYYNGYYIAVAAGGTIRYSTDAVTWSTPTWDVQPTLPLYSIIPFNGRVFASGHLSTIVSSTDGINWTQYYPSLWGAGLNYQNRTLLYFNGSYRCYTSSANDALVSTDGVTWTLQGSGQQLDYVINDGTRLVGLTSASIFTSTDGITWTSSATLTSNGNSLDYYNGRYYVGANSGGNIHSSTNAITWSTVSTNSASGAITDTALNSDNTLSLVNVSLPLPGFSITTTGTNWQYAGLSSTFQSAGASDGLSTVIASAGVVFYASNSNLNSWTYEQYGTIDGEAVRRVVSGKTTTGNPAWAIAEPAGLFLSTNLTQWVAVADATGGGDVIWDDKNNYFVSGRGTTGAQIAYHTITDDRTVTSQTISISNFFSSTTAPVNIVAGYNGVYAFAMTGSDQVAIGTSYTDEDYLYGTDFGRNTSGSGNIRGIAVGLEKVIALTSTGRVFYLDVVDATTRNNLVLSFSTTGGTATIERNINYNWREASMPYAFGSGISADAYYNNGTYAVLLTDGSLYTSTNATTWTIASIGLPTNTYSSLGRFSDNQYVIGGLGSVYYTTGGELTSAYSLYRINLPTL